MLFITGRHVKVPIHNVTSVIPYANGKQHPDSKAVFGT